MREYVLRLRYGADGRSWIETWLNGDYLQMQDTSLTVSRVWRAKLRARAKEVLGVQPDVNFSIKGEALQTDGTLRKVGVWAPGERKKWFGDTVEERGTVQKRPRREVDWGKEAKWLAMLQTARTL